MGQAIVYCWKCQNKILATDFAEGKAFQSGGRTTCTACAGDLVRALEGDERQALISQISRAAAGSPAPEAHPARKTARFVVRDQTPKTPVLHTEAMTKSAASDGFPRSAVAGIAAAVIAAVAVLWGISSGGRERPQPPPPSTPIRLPAPTDSEASRRGKAADQAILKARGAAASGADLDAQARLWSEAVEASEGTPRRAEAVRERDALLAHRKESYAKESSQLDGTIDGLVTRREYREAADFLKSARRRHEGDEWTSWADRRLAGVLEKEKSDAKMSEAVPRDGLALWLRADAGVTLDGTRVSRWADQSDRHRDAVQNSAGARPVLSPGGLNGKPCLTFDGAATSMSFDLPVNGLEGVTILLVGTCPAERKGAAGSDFSAIYWDAGGPNGKLYLAPSQTGIRFKLGTGAGTGDVVVRRPSPIEGRPTLSVLRKDGAVDSLYVDGSLLKQQATTGPRIGDCADRGALGFGKNNTHFSGSLAEVLVYGRALTDAERSRVERALADKYGLPQR